MKPRLTGADLLRTFACISVIFTHVTAEILSMGIATPQVYVFLVALNRFCLSNVPIFVFLSGLVLYYRYEKQTLPLTSFWVKRVQATFLPYAIWSAIYYAAFAYFGLVRWSSQSFLLGLLTGNTVYHLYFVIIILQFYFLFPFIKMVFDRMNSHFVLLLSLGFTFGGFQFSEYGWSQGWPSYIMDRHFLSYLFFFVLGCYMAKHYKAITTRKLPALALLLSFLLQTFLKISLMGILYIAPTHSWNVYYLPLWLLFSSVDIVIFTLITSRISLSETSLFHCFSSFIGSHSFTIYLSHPLLLMLITKVAHALHVTHPMSLFTMYSLFTIAGSGILSKILTKIQWKTAT